jgi:hypothetical protein
VTGDGRLVTDMFGELRSWVPEGPTIDGRFVAADGHERLVFRMDGERGVSFRENGNSQTYRRTGFLQRASLIGALAGLTGAAALITLIGLAIRNRRELRQNETQARVSIVQNIQAGLWLSALLLFAAWGLGSDIETIVYSWPNPLVATASACALVASLMTLLTLIALPRVWQGGRRVDSWNVARKAAYTATVLIYAAFALVLAGAGALLPWAA